MSLGHWPLQRAFWVLLSCAWKSCWESFWLVVVQSYKVVALVSQLLMRKEQVLMPWRIWARRGTIPGHYFMINFALATLSWPLSIEHPRCKMFLFLLNRPLTLCLRWLHWLLLPYDIQHLCPLPLYQLTRLIFPRGTCLLGILACQPSDGHGLVIPPLLSVLLLHMLDTCKCYISLYLLLLSVDLLPDLTANPLTEALLSLLAHHSCHHLLLLPLN